MVNALEDEFGFRLLLRGKKKGVTLTKEGEKVLPLIRELMLQEGRLSQVVSEINGCVVGNIHIGAYSSIAMHWLPTVIREFQNDHPQVQISLAEGTWHKLDRWLSSKRIDMAFYCYRGPMNWDWIPLAEDEMIAVLPMDHPLAEADAYPLACCPGEKFIMPAMGHDSALMDLLERNGISPQIAFSTLKNFSAISMIEQRMGMSIMNRLITQGMDYQVAKLPLDPPQSITMGIAIPSKRSAPPAVQLFIDYAVRLLQKL